MNTKAILALAFIFCLLSFNHSPVKAQSLTNEGETNAQADAPKFEVGAQFTIIRIDNNPISIASNERRSEPGIGGRFAYNLNRHVTLESEVNFFPRAYNGFLTPLSGGRITQGLFGVKVGRRGERFGVFGKARPGFVRYGSTVANVRFPGGNGPDQGNPFGIESGSTTHLALDVGGVVEYYPSHRTILRFDLGDTIIRYADIPVFDSNRGSINVTERQHNGQYSVGFGVRF